MKIYIIVGLFILLDFITGFIKAIYKGELNSTILKKGLFNKLAEILGLALCTLFEYATQQYNLGFTLPLVKVIGGYICLMETISIIENICLMNTKLTSFFKPYLEKLKGNEHEQ